MTTGAPLSCQRAIDGLEYFHHLLAVTGACDRRYARSDTLQEVPALFLSGFADFEPGTHDIPSRICSRYSP